MHVCMHLSVIYLYTHIHTFTETQIIFVLVILMDSHFMSNQIYISNYRTREDLFSDTEPLGHTIAEYVNDLL